jgi:endonuclease/exonuclease/phosphatase family metal-dependent hydrolase
MYVHRCNRKLLRTQPKNKSITTLNNMLTKTSYFKYDFGKMLWVEHRWFANQSKSQPTSLIDYTPYFPKKNNLVVASFNVLFDIFPDMEGIIQSPVRYAYQMKKLLPSIKADIIALQEVTEQYLAKLLEQQWVQTDYYVTQFSSKTTFNPTRDTNRRFMVVILSKIPILESYLYFFDKKNCPQGGRPAVVCVLPYPGSDPNARFVVSSCHLKAGIDFYDTRRKQFGELFRLFGVTESHNQDKNQPQDLKGKTNTVILLGDTNMQRVEEEEYIPENVVDAWKKLKPDDLGITYDAKANSMIAQMYPDDTKKLRFDRIFVCNSTDGVHGQWQPKQTVLFATQNISNIHTSLMASDHYGLAAQLVLEK